MPILLRTPTTNVAACITLANTAGFVAFYRASHAMGRLMLVFKEFGKFLTDLKFVTDIMDYICGENSVIWRNFRFL